MSPVRRSVGGHRLARRLGVVPVALHDIGAANAQLAVRTQRHLDLLVQADYLDLDARHRNAAGARTVRADAGRGRGHGAGFGHAPAFLQPALRQAHEFLEHLGSDGRAARIAELEGGQVCTADVRMAREGHIHGRHTQKDADLAGHDCVERRLQVKTLVQDQLGADAQAEQHVHDQRIDVEQRQDRQKRLLAFRERAGAHQRVPHLRHGRTQVRMREHGALGVAGGSAGVLQHGHGLQGGRLGPCGPGGRRGLEQVGEAQALRVPGHGMRVLRGAGAAELVHRADDQAAQPRRAQKPVHLCEQDGAIERHDEVGFAVADLVLQRSAGVQRRVIHHRRARLEHRKEADDVVRRVRQIEPDVGAGPYPRRSSPWAMRSDRSASSA